MSELSQQNKFKAYCVVRGYIPIPFAAGPFETLMLAIDTKDPTTTLPGVVYDLACSPISNAAREFMGKHIDAVMVPKLAQIIVFPTVEWEENPTAEDASNHLDQVLGSWNEVATEDVHKRVSSWLKTLK